MAEDEVTCRKRRNGGRETGARLMERNHALIAETR